jgi:hypothetical protein
MTQRYTDDEMLGELRRVHAEIGRALSRPAYIAARGRISAPAIEKRFGGWLSALERAGVPSPYRFGGQWFACPVCGDAFRSNAGRKSRRTCSEKCARVIRSGERSALWLGDDVTPQAARARARRQVCVTACERCGHDGSRYRLDVHHRDGNPYHNDPANLEVLCRSCHMREHAARKRSA